MTIYALFIIVALFIAGCDATDTIKNGLAHSKAVSVEIEKTTGLKSFVGFQWNNGSLNSVSINFESLPGNLTLSEIAKISKKAVIKEFKQEPRKIIVAFAMDGVSLPQLTKDDVGIEE